MESEMMVREITPEQALRQLHREYAVLMDRAVRAERTIAHLVFAHGPLELPVEREWFPPDLGFKETRDGENVTLKTVIGRRR